MDIVTELTCPECGEQQANTEECSSCGASLLSHSENIQAIQGEKSVSAPWPTQSPTTPKSSASIPKTELGQDECPKVKTAFESTETPSNVLEESKNTNQSSTSMDWPRTINRNDGEQVIEPSEFPLSQQEAASDQDFMASRDQNTQEQPSAVDSSDSTTSSRGPEDEPPTPIAIPQEAASSSHQIKHPLFWGTGRSLFGIFIVNTFLTLITLGIYSFWGRARVREFLNSQTSFAGARFAYHGTGRELLTGWMKAMLVFGLPYLFLSSLSFFWQGIPEYVPQGIAGVLVLCFIPVAVVGAHRYRLSRTSLRNIRFSFRGTVSDYTKLWMKGSALTVLTFGFYYPFFENARRHYLVTHSQFGSHALDYDGNGKGLLTIYSKAAGLFALTLAALIGIMVALLANNVPASRADLHTMILTSKTLPFILPISLIVPWFYLQAARQRFFWNHTWFGDARFVSTVTAWKILELRLGHLILLLSTLGLAWPWVQVRNLQFFYYYTGLHGDINLHRVAQDALDASPTGEELAGFFDTGFDLG